jgi:hypothetical protein
VKYGATEMPLRVGIVAVALGDSEGEGRKRGFYACRSASRHTDSEDEAQGGA